MLFLIIFSTKKNYFRNFDLSFHLFVVIVIHCCIASSAKLTFASLLIFFNIKTFKCDFFE